MNDVVATPGSSGIWDERRLRFAAEAAGVALWSWNVDSDQITMDRRAFQLWGLPLKSQITFAELSACIHPADRDTVRAAFSATRDLTGAYEIDFRIMHGSDIRWVSARGQGDDQGIRERTLYGVFLDVTFRKIAEEERQVLLGEMQHRIKNLFSLALSLALIASRHTETKAELLQDLTLRLRGLAAAHQLIMPGLHQNSVRLVDLLKSLLEAYVTARNDFQNISIIGVDVLVGERSITSVAMLIHELATNSAKYGALSADRGKLVVSCTDQGSDVEVVWKESGGPARPSSDETAGFGSKMIERVISQVNGSITRKWTDAGLAITLRMSKASLEA